MSIKSLQAHVARQLNDHHDSPSGVEQATYFEWTEDHITEALCLGLSYLYSIKKDDFSKLQELVVEKEDCIIDFCDECGDFLSIASVDDKNGGRCGTVSEINNSGDSNSLSSLLGDICTDDGVEDSTDYEYEMLNGSSCIVKFTETIQAGTKINYLCAIPPDENSLNDPSLTEYHPLILSFALWWLLLTDSESKSNLARAEIYRLEMKEFVTMKMLLEFSLHEDDYSMGRRRVDDN